MPRWPTKVITRIRRLTAAGKIRFTSKAVHEITVLGIPLTEQDCRIVVMSLSFEEFDTRVRSSVSTEWLYVFRPCVLGMPLYVKVALRDECVVVSFHEEENDDAR